MNNRQIIFIIVGVVFLGIAIFLAIDLGGFIERGKDFNQLDCDMHNNPNLYPECKK